MKSLPNEATTESITRNAIQESHAMQSYIESLTHEERQRFMEFAHHLVDIGFHDGLQRPIPSHTAEQRVLIDRRDDRMTGAAYMRGFIDCLEVVEQAHNLGTGES